MFAYAYSIAFNYYSRLAHVLHVERVCISTVYYIIRMCFSASNNFIIVVTVVVPRVCVCLFVVFRRHVHLDPDVRVHRGTENSFIYIYNMRCFFVCLVSMELHTVPLTHMTFILSEPGWAWAGFSHSPIIRYDG